MTTDSAQRRDQLPRRTVLQRAIVDHLKAGRHWYWRRGRFPI